MSEQMQHDSEEDYATDNSQASRPHRRTTLVSEERLHELSQGIASEPTGMCVEEHYQAGGDNTRPPAPQPTGSFRRDRSRRGRRRGLDSADSVSSLAAGGGLESVSHGSLPAIGEVPSPQICKDTRKAPPSSNGLPTENGNDNGHSNGNHHYEYHNGSDKRNPQKVLSDIEMKLRREEMERQHRRLKSPPVSNGSTGSSHDTQQQSQPQPQSQRRVPTAPSSLTSIESDIERKVRRDEEDRQRRHGTSPEHQKQDASTSNTTNGAKEPPRRPVNGGPSSLARIESDVERKVRTDHEESRRRMGASIQQLEDTVREKMDGGSTAGRPPQRIESLPVMNRPVQRDPEKAALARAASMDPNGQASSQGARPGAYSVEGSGSSRTRPPNPSSNRSSPGPAASKALPVAAVVVEDIDRDELNQKAEALRRQEMELAEKMARLKQWEEQLKLQQDALQSKGNSSHLNPFSLFHSTKHHQDSIVRAEVVSTDTQSFTSEPSSSRIPAAVSVGPFSRAGSRQDDASSIGDTTFHEATVDALSVDLPSTTSELGPGPLRFSAPGEKPFSEQLSDLHPRNLRTFRCLAQRWEDRRAKQQALGARNGRFEMPPSWHMRYCRYYARKDGSFPEEKVWSAEKKLNVRFLRLQAAPLVQQLRSKTLFPVPGLKTKEGHEMFYMRPSRYVPGETTTKMIIDNLCYVMNTMLEKEHAQKEGIGFVACMDGWKMRNFEVNYCYQFMMALQGFMVPVQTQLFLIVNPPGWFGVIWKIMRPMLSPSFRKRVKICRQQKIGKYLMDGYEKYLPDDMRGGCASTEAIVSDFIAYRMVAERHLVAASVSEDHHEDSRSVSQFSDDVSSIHRSVVDIEERTHASKADSQSSVAITDQDDDASIDASIGEDEMLDGEDMKQAALDVEDDSPEYNGVYGRRR